MRICSGISYVVAYVVFVMLYGSPSHHHLANAASTTEDDDLQMTKVLLTGKMGAPSNTKAKPPLGDVLSEEKEEEANRDFTAIHDVSRKVGVSSSLSSVDECVQQCFSLEPLEPSTSPSDSTETPICSDDTSWRYDGKSSKHCGWVYFSPDRHCSKLSVDGIPASEACPIACGDLRTNSCDIPKCMDDSWFNNVGKNCNGYLHQGVSVKGRCRNIGVVTTLGNDQKSFAYQYCSKCRGHGNACGALPIISRDELKDAVSDYCGDPEPWTTNSKYGPIEEWDVSSIDDMSGVFYSQSNCNPNIADWDVSGVTNFDWMFDGAYFFNQDIGGWDVSKGTSFSYMFASATFFNQDIGGWNVSKGTDFSGMFDDATSFNQDIGGWDVSKGTGFGYMFYYASLFNQDLCDWEFVYSAYTTYFCEGAISCGLGFGPCAG